MDSPRGVHVRQADFSYGTLVSLDMPLRNFFFSRIASHTSNCTPYNSFCVPGFIENEDEGGTAAYRTGGRENMVFFTHS